MIKLPSLGFDDVHDNDGELELCNRLKAARAEAGLSQAELAGLVGVSRQTISSIETGLFNLRQSWPSSSASRSTRSSRICSTSSEARARARLGSTDAPGSLPDLAGFGVFGQQQVA